MGLKLGGVDFPGFGMVTMYACSISGGNDAKVIAAEYTEARVGLRLATNTLL